MTDPAVNRNLTLLLIEDDLVDQMAFNREIRDRHPACNFRIAGSLTAAREILAKEPVDIVVCDYYLGDGTLFEILPELRKRGIPVIAVTGAEDEAAATDARANGVFDFLVKDQNYNYLKVLPQVIERAIGKGPIHCRDRDPAAPIPPGTAPEMLPGVEEVHFRRLVIDQSELIARYRPDGAILFVNDVYCRYFGMSRGELIGQTSEPLLPAEDPAALVRKRAILNPEHPAVVSEYRIRLASSGELRWVQRTDRALFNEQGSIIEYQMVARDITERKQAEEALKESEERYRMLAEHAFDGILIQDFTGTILYVNQSIARMFGFAHAEDVLGMNSLSFISEKSREAVIRDFQNVQGGKQGYLQKYTAVKPGGEEIIVESVGTQITYHGKPANIVALRDVTERERAEERLKKELERKKDFINVAAHELRTPLQPVIGYLDLLIDESVGYHVSPEILTVLRKVKTYVETERHLVSQILELSLLESVHEHFWPAMEPVHVRELVDLIVRQSRYDSEAEITIVIPADLRISSNGPYIQEILDEILVNAVNYSRPPRKIAVTSVETETELRLSVADNGIGIAPEKQEIIFDPFYLSDADKLSRKYGRLGVGLAMARSRATRLGGTITVSSILGSGSTFTLTLPKKTP
jgi:PAS domain S-box-containing protein